MSVSVLLDYSLSTNEIKIKKYKKRSKATVLFTQKLSYYMYSNIKHKVHDMNHSIDNLAK